MPIWNRKRNCVIWKSARGIDLSSNDYLGLATDPRMKQTILEAVDSAPRIASTGSRLLSGHDEAWTTLENDFASWVGAEAALYFTSGYAANIGLLSAILRAEDVVFSDSANHASLIDGMRLAKCQRVIFPHLDLNALEDRTSPQPFRCRGAIHCGRKHFQHGWRPRAARRSRRACRATWRGTHR